MANLYSIKLEYLRIMEDIEENDGELTEDILAELELLEDAKEDFIDSMCLHIQNLIGDVNQITPEIERLTERKNAANQKIDTTKKAIIKLLKQFDMKSLNKKSSGYAFKTAQFSGFTRSFKSVKVDEIAIANKFAPIIGDESEYINYTVSCKVDRKQLKQLNELGIIPITAYTPTVDKKSLMEYLQLLAQSHEQSSETDSETVEVKVDPIADYASILSTESLIIK